MFPLLDRLAPQMVATIRGTVRTLLADADLDEEMLQIRRIEWSVALGTLVGGMSGKGGAL